MRRPSLSGSLVYPSENMPIVSVSARSTLAQVDCQRPICRPLSQTGRTRQFADQPEWRLATQSWMARANCGLDKSIPTRASESDNCSTPSTTPAMRPFATGSLKLGSASGKLDSILAIPPSTLRSIPNGSRNARFLSIIPISTSSTAVLSTIQPAMSNGRLWPP